MVLLFAEVMTVYVENLKRSTHKLLALKRELQRLLDTKLTFKRNQ